MAVSTLGASSSAEDETAVRLPTLIGQPFEAFDDALGKPAVVGFTSMNKPMRLYKPNHKSVATVEAQWWKDDLVPAAIIVTFKKGGVKQWDEALKAIGVAVPKSAHLSKYGREVHAGDNVVGIPNIGASISWAPLPNGAVLAFTLTRQSLDAGNKRYVQMKKEGKIRPVELTQPEASPNSDTQASKTQEIAVPQLLDRKAASRTISPGNSPFVVGSGYEETNASWKAIGPGTARAVLIWHLWPYPSSGQDFDALVKLRATEGLQLSSTHFSLQISKDGVTKFDYPLGAANGIIAPEVLAATMELQVSRRGRRIMVLVNGSLLQQGEIPVQTASYRTDSMRLELQPSKSPEVFEIRWRTPGFKADITTRAPKLFTALAKLRDRMTIKQVQSIMGSPGHFVEAGNMPNGRWVRMFWKVKGLGTWDGNFLNDSLYGGSFLFDSPLGVAEMLRSLGIVMKSWNPVSMDPERGWESSFEKAGLATNGAKISEGGDGKRLWIEWRDEAKVHGRSN